MSTLVTGHTGFKGSWLIVLLSVRGSSVSGIALDPETASIYERIDCGSLVSVDARCDIREENAIARLVDKIAPQALFHFAAQPLVRSSYAQPALTIGTNVIGTMNILMAIGHVTSVKSQVIVTTDKVYRNVGQERGYVEDDPLGGHDPYSASKAMADLLTQSWVSSFHLPPTGIARAGNVIGGGDISRDRLVPDLIRSFREGQVARIRYPDAVRPWQHVLDCLNGYLMLSDHLRETGISGAWNFGPPPESAATVAEIATLTARLWGRGARWEVDHGDHPHEADLLTLDSSKARSDLGWRDRLSLEESISWVVEWHRRVDAGENARDVTFEQVLRFDERG